MGASYEFRCGSCGYEAEVSGRDDAGFFVNTTTILCEGCEELYDVVTARRPMDPAEEPDPGPIEPMCPKSKRHIVRSWEHPGPCPKCGSPMTMGNMLMLWD